MWLHVGHLSDVVSITLVDSRRLAEGMLRRSTILRADQACASGPLRLLTRKPSHWRLGLEVMVQERAGIRSSNPHWVPAHIIFQRLSELQRFGNASQHMCSPESTHGEPPREEFRPQLCEARGEWKGRNQRTIRPRPTGTNSAWPGIALLRRIFQYWQSHLWVLLRMC
jgi:hypothetical protein